MIEPSDVREGDIVFCSRPGFLQSLCDSAGELWRHVGLALEIDTPQGRQMGIVEVDGDRFVTRPLSAVQTAYQWLAVGRVADGVRTDHAVDWARFLIGSRHAYAWDDAIVAGVVAFIRFRVGDADPNRAARMVRRASAAASQRWSQRRVTHTCSSFIYFAFNSGDAEDRLIVDLEATRQAAEAALMQTPVPTLRAGRGSRIDGEQLAEAARVLVGTIGGGSAPASMSNEAMGRWTMPGDIWRSPSIRYRGRLSTSVLDTAHSGGATG
ncbi:MAG: hypothetical protein HKN24_00435 [Acidimicrobiales bacterium]|nr:hypothetical protein [Acidimicrobiales bacterium]